MSKDQKKEQGDRDLAQAPDEDADVGGIYDLFHESLNASDESDDKIIGTHAPKRSRSD